MWGKIMDHDQIIFSGHAVRQMFAREIAINDVIEVVNNGQIIIDYPETLIFNMNFIGIKIGDVNGSVFPH